MSDIFWLKTLNIKQGITPPLVYTVNMRKELASLVKENAFVLEAETKASPNMPVDTGALRDSIEASEDKNPMTWKVDDNVSYGEWQELGTRYVSAKHFLGGAAMKIADRFFDAVAKVVGGKKSGEKETSWTGVGGDL